MATYQVIVQGGYMSGDMFGVAAAMLLKPDVFVNIVKGTGKAYLDVMDDQTDRLVAFYTEVLGTVEVARRVAVGQVADPQAYIKSITLVGGMMDQSKAPGIRGLFTAMKSTDTAVLHRIGKATDIVSKAFDWGTIVDGFTRDDIQGNLKIFLEGARYRKLLDPYSPRVFLWVRINKRKPKATAHLELDTSVEGLRQLTAQIAAANVERRKAKIPEWIIALTGDRVDLSAAKNKVLKDHCVDMMEFWNDPTWKKEWGRRGQLTAFAFMFGRNAQMVNLGMRSGGLEGPALLGIPTIYMEEEDNPQQDRMKKWVGPVKLHLGSSTYHRLGLQTLPTRTGQAIKSAPGKADPSTVARLLDEATQEEAGTNRDRLAAAKVEYHKSPAGTSFGDFFSIYLQLANDLWGWLDEACSTWRQYSIRNPASAKEIRRRVGQWYGMRVEKSGAAAKGGFAAEDLDAIMHRLEELLPDPPKPPVEEPPKPVIVQPLPSVKPLTSVKSVSLPPSNLKPPKPLREMAKSTRQRWNAKLRNAGLDPQDFY